MRREHRRQRLFTQKIVLDGSNTWSDPRHGVTMLQISFSTLLGIFWYQCTSTFFDKELFVSTINSVPYGPPNYAIPKALLRSTIPVLSFPPYLLVPTVCSSPTPTCLFVPTFVCLHSFPYPTFFSVPAVFPSPLFFLSPGCYFPHGRTGIAHRKSSNLTENKSLLWKKSTVLKKVTKFCCLIV